MKSKRILTLFFTLFSFYSFSQLVSGVSQGPAENSNPFLAGQIENDPENLRIISIVNKVEEKSNFLDRLLPDSNLSLPFGIIKQLGAVRYVIAIDSMHFQSQGAYFSAYAALDFPGTQRKLAFRGSHLKFNPSGVIGGDQSRLYLASTHLIRINNTVSLKLLGNGQNWVEWDCNGFKAINLVGNFIFNKGKIMPDPTQTKDSSVTASFQIYTKDLHDFITAVSITPFKIEGLEDWAFSVKTALVDMSELANSNEMIFPVGYSNPNMVTPAMWKGFYLKELKVKLPREVSKNGKKTEIVARNLLIDHMGFSGLLSVNNLFEINEGSMSGWNFSVSELGVGFTCNKLSSGHLMGRVNIPIMDSTATLQYSADLTYNPYIKDVDYAFLIKTESNIRFNIFSAIAMLGKNSSISVSKSQGYFKPVANLNGLIAFDDPKFNSNGGKLAFQNLTIHTDAPYVTNGMFSLCNINGGQTKASNYPVSIEDIVFGLDQGAPVLGMNAKLNFSEMANNDLTASTSILLRGKIEKRQELYGEGATITKTRWSFDKVVINGASIEVETSPFTVKGNILFKDNDPVYGNGFFGLLELSIKKVINEPISVNVGFGSMEDYRYFFLDAKVPAKYIMPGTPFGLSNIIGGLYYHMTPNKTADDDFIAMSQNLKNTVGNALTYVPSPTIGLGLRLGVALDFILNESVCNGDCVLDINFFRSGSLGAINLRGNIYSMAKVSNKINAPVKGKMVITYNAQSKTFDGLAQVNMNVYQVIKGSGYFKLHFDPQDWYMCIGKPSNPNRISFLNLVEAPSYFMTGNNIEPALNPPPSSSAARDITELQNGRGFCAGAKLHSKFDHRIGLNFFNVEGKCDFDLGFDLMMFNYGENATCSNSEQKIGLNGRLLQGDAYLNLKALVKINGQFKFPSNCPTTTSSHLLCGSKHCCCITIDWPCIINESFSYTVFDATVNAIVSAQIPKPFYFSGSFKCPFNLFDKIQGDFSFDYKYGEYCTPVKN